MNTKKKKGGNALGGKKKGKKKRHGKGERGAYQQWQEMAQVKKKIHPAKI